MRADDSIALSRRGNVDNHHQ